MPRAKGGAKTRQRRKKILKKAKGYVGGRSRLYRTAAETVLRAGAFAYRRSQGQEAQRPRALDRPYQRGLLARRGSRTRCSWPASRRPVSCSNRKVLSELAVSDPAGFAKLVESAKAAAAR